MKTLKINKIGGEFSLSDYGSNDGMLTAVWGPSFWHFLHSMSFNYPITPTKNEKINYMKFILSMKHILPCGKCRKNLAKNLKKMPITMAHMLTRETFSTYVYELHEVINNMLCKKSGLTYEEVRDTYEHFRARCQKTKKYITVKKKDEKGCIIPFYGRKTKCVLRIVPENRQCKTFSVE